MFFQNIKNLDFSGDLVFKISHANENELNVIVYLNNPNNPDKATVNIQPMVFVATPAELDASLFDSITEPIVKTNTMFVNMEQYYKGLEKAKEESAVAKAIKDKNDSKKKEWEKIYEKIKELSDELEYDKAYQLLPTNLDEFKVVEKDIKRVKEYLESKKSVIKLF